MGQVLNLVVDRELRKHTRSFLLLPAFSYMYFKKYSQLLIPKTGKLSEEKSWEDKEPLKFKQNFLWQVQKLSLL
jgi:hypothetical protein